MSSNDRSTAPHDTRADRPGLFERLRLLFGLGAPSIRDDIEDALDDTTPSAEFSLQEKVILKNVLSLHDLRVEHVMVPRADIIAISMDTPLDEVLKVFRTAGHSRLPVHADTLDDPRGMVHIRDFVNYIAASAELAGGRRTKIGSNSTDMARIAGYAGINLSVALADTKIVRPVLFAPPSMPVLDLLVRMQSTRTHMALVIDEYGGTDGLVSLEDIVEMVVGDIEDEHDTDERPHIEALPNGGYIADARSDLEEMSAMIGADLTTRIESEEVHTLGGLATAIAGRVPLRGEILQINEEFELEVLDADPRRVKRVRIGRMPKRDPDVKETDTNLTDNSGQSHIAK